MVCSGGDGERVLSMEMGTTSGGVGGAGEERSFKAPLHNFNLPSFLKWGHQRQLRCMKLPENDAASAGVYGKRVGAGGDRSRSNRSPPTATRLKRSAAAAGIGGEEGIEAVREKIMFDLKTAAERMKDAIFRKEATSSSSSSDEEVVVEEKAGAEAEEVRRWNLRTRRGSAIATGKSSSPATVVVAGVAAMGGGNIWGSGRRMVGGGSIGGGYSPSPLPGENGGGREEKKREKFAVALTRKEIEEDFMAMVGHRPARRPKKRPRNVQRQMDTLFPGLWLTEVTVDTYKVPEAPDTGKR